MKPNIGSIDRALRLALGIVILVAGYYYRSAWGLIGLIPLLTAVVRFCPAYTLLHLNTCGAKTDQPPKA